MRWLPSTRKEPDIGNCMVKIVVMDWESFSKMVKRDIEEGLKRGSFAKQDDVIYAESLEAALRKANQGGQKD